MSSPAGNGTISLDAGAGLAATSQNQSFATLLASISTAAVGFGVQFAVFYILRLRLSRIYRPKSYLVAERQRVPEPPSGPFELIVPLFTTSNTTFIEKCGLDAYFFLRYLRMLLKLFAPMAVVILPILLPINKYSSGPVTEATATGVDKYGWGHVGKIHASRRWAHLILAVCVILWFCYVVYTELRGYIRVRQAYLASPEHRIRASATTVLVSGIPRKWLTLEALNGLYDVFPGGIRNIWINRNFDELYQKVQDRDKIARQLEKAETVLIKECVKKHKAALEKAAKQEGRQKRTKAEKQQDDANDNDRAEELAQGNGMSTGDPHQIPHNLHEAVDDIDHPEHRKQREEERSPGTGLYKPLAVVGQGLGAVGHGFGALGQFGKNFFGDVTEDITQTTAKVTTVVDTANTGGGFVTSDSLYDIPSTETQPQTQYPSYGDRSRGRQPPLTKVGADRSVRTVPSNTNTTFSAPRLELPDGSLPRGQTEPQSADGLTHGPSTGDEPSSPYSNVDRRAVSEDNEDSFDHLRPKDVNTPSTKKSPIKAALSTTVAKVRAMKKDPPLAFPSPQPHTIEGDEYPLDNLGQGHNDLSTKPEQRVAGSKWVETCKKMFFWKKQDEEAVKEEYPEAYDKEWAVVNIADEDGDPTWRKYIEPKDRETLREPIVNKSWFPRLPLVGKKIDKISHLRKELARLNVEIEHDQNDVEKYPFMNSAFIQFNHQVAAHMACQSLSHHVPQHMAPRLIEISPNDVLWSNMSIKWWERYIRTGIVIAACVGLIILYAFPVAFTGALSQIDVLANEYHWLHWLANLPKAVIAIIQGALPPILLSVILLLVPIIFRALVHQQGVATGNDKELGVQQFYFIFLFIQVFFVASISTGLTNFITSAVSDPENVVTEIATDLPKASNYFFSYMIVQALGNSAGALLQVGTLLFWFILGPILDTTARQKWARQTKLQNVQWGSFFPPFTNFAVIGLVYSVISPLIMVFNLISFSLYWIVQRYNVLYVYKFDSDTGGLLFPAAINQLFTGIYVMEVCLIGLFFLQVDANNNVACVPQAIIMIICLVFTVVYQVLLNDAFKPLFRYLPITLEDDAVIRDERFAKAQHAKWQGLTAEETEEGDDIEDRLEDQERKEEEADRMAEEAEREHIRQHRQSSHGRDVSQPIDTSPRKTAGPQTKPTSGSWKQDPWRKAYKAPTIAIKRFKSVRTGSQQPTQSGYTASRDDHEHDETQREPEKRHGRLDKLTATTSAVRKARQNDMEAQKAVGDVLFSGYADELEDLTVEERDTLVRYSFQHAALRARRPVVWIPRDPLGVSDDEIARCKKLTTVCVRDGEGEKESREEKTNVWMSNEGTALDSKGRVVFRRSPPDFANVDLIAL